MIRKAVTVSILFVFLVFALALRAQHQHGQTAQAGSPATTAGQPTQQDVDAATEAESMHIHHHDIAATGDDGMSGGEGSGHHHQMGPHMKMSSLRDPVTGDTERAQKIVDTARASVEKYKNVKAAEADGYKIFMPQVKQQKQYHFTNYKYALEAEFRFNPEHPTSLLYEKVGGPDSDQFKLIGLMYTAPKRYNEDDLNERIPLSMAQWHQHVNLCMPPKGVQEPMYGPKARFGLGGSIASKEDCDAAGGTFKPVIFNWMVHVYPYEKTMDAIWSVERQMPKGHDMNNMQGLEMKKDTEL